MRFSTKLIDSFLGGEEGRVPGTVGCLRNPTTGSHYRQKRSQRYWNPKGPHHSPSRCARRMWLPPRADHVVVCPIWKEPDHDMSFRGHLRSGQQRCVSNRESSCQAYLFTVKSREEVKIRFSFPSRAKEVSAPACCAMTMSTSSTLAQTAAFEWSQLYRPCSVISRVLKDCIRGSGVEQVVERSADTCTGAQLSIV